MAAVARTEALWWVSMATVTRVPPLPPGWYDPFVGSAVRHRFPCLRTSAQERWRAITGAHLVALVRSGARLENGFLVERDETVAA